MTEMDLSTAFDKLVNTMDWDDVVSTIYDVLINSKLISKGYVDQQLDPPPPCAAPPEPAALQYNRIPLNQTAILNGGHEYYEDRSKALPCFEVPSPSEAQAAPLDEQLYSPNYIGSHSVYNQEVSPREGR